MEELYVKLTDFCLYLHPGITISMTLRHRGFAALSHVQSNGSMLARLGMGLENIGLFTGVALRAGV